MADELGPVWHATGAAFHDADPPIPYWAFAWAGGIALARYLTDHPDEVTGKDVFDMATGSGLVAVVAALAGAAKITAADIDPIAETAVALNARANGVWIDFIGDDLLDRDPPRVDVLLCADTWYQEPMGRRFEPWLRAAAAQGTRVLIADPGRRYLPASGLTPLARYEVETTTQLEDRAVVSATVYELLATH
jgi:predicted nicotinamide N-methyase